MCGGGVRAALGFVLMSDVCWAAGASSAGVAEPLVGKAGVGRRTPAPFSLHSLRRGRNLY